MRNVLKGLSVILLMCLFIFLMGMFKTFAAIVIITGIVLGVIHIAYYIGDSFKK